MLSISSVLEFIKRAVDEKDPRYDVLNDEHVLDLKSGVELHMYDDWFKVTYKDEVIATKTDFTKKEQDIIWTIKQAISDPEDAKFKDDNYTELQKGRREKLSALFESPTPVDEGLPEEEADTTDYQG
jgi:hypothetical protein